MPSAQSVAIEDTPEWRVLRAKRDEIENDPALSEEARASLRSEWAVQADQTLARLQSATPSGEPMSSRSTPSRWPVAVTLTLGVAIYALLGRWDGDALGWHGTHRTALAATDQVPPRDEAKHPGDNLSLDARIEGLQAKLAQDPKDVNGWVLLARSYGIQRKFSEGAAALEKALALEPGHPDLLADLADMLAMTLGKTLKGRPTQLIEQALKSDPAHQKSLALAATAAMERNDRAAATQYWQRLRATLPADSPDLAQIDATLQSLGAEPSPAPRAAAPVSGPAISGRVMLEPALAARLKQQGLPQSAVVFVVARVPGGMPMPVAVAKLSPAELLSSGALAFRLDDSTSMSPQFKLSDQKTLNIEARLSMSGTAARGADDLSIKADAVRLGADNLSLTLR